jgi:hypothetical protein
MLDALEELNALFFLNVLHHLLWVVHANFEFESFSMALNSNLDVPYDVKADL